MHRGEEGQAPSSTVCNSAYDKEDSMDKNPNRFYVYEIYDVDTNEVIYVGAAGFLVVTGTVAVVAVLSITINCEPGYLLI